MVGLTTPEEVMKVTSMEEEVVTERQAQEPLDTEKRIYQRLPNRIHLSYKVFKTQEEITKRGISPEALSVTKNISAGGILFISKDNLAVGSILEVKIELPDDEKPIECLARVVRVEDTGQDNNFDIALCFLDITSAQRARLDRFVETVLR
jgi:c-di-GMP-binding flagellar brake protein YcgR